MANEKKFEVVGNVSIVSTGKRVEMEKEEFEKVADTIVNNVGQGQSLTDMYDRFSKLLYVVDSSSSMGDGMLSEDWLKLYKWPTDIVEAFRDAMRNEYKQEFKNWKQDFDAIDPDTLSDEEIKMEALRENLSAKYGIKLERDYGIRKRSRTKMMALKDAAKKFVHERFQKFSDAKVGVFKFTTRTTLLCAAGASEEEVMVVLNNLPDGGNGGTEIYQAVERAVNECKKRPSEVNLHHLVFVSDGEDYSGSRVKDLLPKMKSLGIVFDFIYMLGATESESYSETVKVLREVCESTGGEFIIVKTEQDFEQKFLAVSNRPMLPPCK